MIEKGHLQIVRVLLFSSASSLGRKNLPSNQMNPPETYHQSFRDLARSGAVAVLFLLPISFAAAADSFAPLSVTLQPKVIQSAVPAWETGSMLVQPGSDTLQIPVPALASQDEIGCFALTVVFADNGDGGPVVEWVPKEGESVLLSAGLGETGIALGLNARTLLITPSLALDGGILRISYTGRFLRLLSATLRPARELSIAALGTDFNPALLGENESPLTMGEVSGTDEPLPSGDRTEGQVIHAELSTAPKQLSAADAVGEMEFIIPLGATPQATLLQTEIAGLDPESQIEVSVNGELLGSLAAAPFSLNAPNTLLSASGRLRIAGWRPASLLIPARLWKAGDNSVVLSLHRVMGDTGDAVYLRKARVDLLFAPAATTSASSSSPAPSPTPIQNTNSVVTPPSTTPSPEPTETLSTGSAYGNPSPSLFHAEPAHLSLK